jgi:lysozyme family protein
VADFYQAIPNLLSHEGGFVIDDGGPTNWGISAKWLRTKPDWRRYDLDGDGILGESDMRALTRDQAIDLYKRYWWSPLFDQIHSQDLATKLLDTEVNMGAGEGVRLLQAALAVAEDGCLGPATIAALNASNATATLAKFRDLQAQHYEAIVRAHPADARYERGWINRAES